MMYMLMWPATPSLDTTVLQMYSVDMIFYHYAAKLTKSPKHNTAVLGQGVHTTDSHKGSTL